MIGNKKTPSPEPGTPSLLCSYDGDVSEWKFDGGGFVVDRDTGVAVSSRQLRFRIDRTTGCRKFFK